MGYRRRLRMVARLVPVLLVGCVIVEGANQTQPGNSLPPPDTGVAASVTRLVETVNSSVSIWDRTTSPYTLISRFKAADFFGAHGLCNGTTQGISDPRIRYDEVSGRWFFVSIETSTPGRWCLAVSQTSLPEGAWYFYAFQPPPAWFGSYWGYQPVFPDFPDVAVGDGALGTVVLTGNLAHGLLGYACVDQSAILVLNKSDLTTGAPPHLAYFGGTNNDCSKFFSLRPSHHYNSFDGTWQIAAGVNIYAEPGTKLRVQLITGTPGVSIPYLTRYDITPDASKPFRQPPAAKQLGGEVQTNDDRVLDVAYRNGQYWVALTQGCFPAGDVDSYGNPIKRSCGRYIMLQSNQLYRGVPQQDMKLIAKKEYYYFPAIALDNAGNLLTVANNSNKNTYIQTVASDRRPSDPPSTLRAPRVLRRSSVTYSDPYFRWGDYSGATSDPAQTGVIFASEYPLGSSTWATQIVGLVASEYP